MFFLASSVAAARSEISIARDDEYLLIAVSVGRKTTVVCSGVSSGSSSIKWTKAELARLVSAEPLDIVD